jgi:hypothetical protein
MVKSNNLVNHFTFEECIVIGGEAFPKKNQCIRDMIANGVTVYNIYGPVEMSCWASCHQVTLFDLEYVMHAEIGNMMLFDRLFLKCSRGCPDWQGNAGNTSVRETRRW